MEKKILRKLEENDYYTLNLEEWWQGEHCEKTEILAAYAKDGSYIGGINDVVQLVGQFGIKPEAIMGYNVSSIGFSERDQKWYGWSHRAIYGFGIGYITKEGDPQTTSGYTDEYIKKHPEELGKLISVGHVCKSFKDCKNVAIAFARSVS